MCKRTEFLVLTWRAARLKVGRAEFGLVLIGVVKLFHTVVGTVTGVALGTAAVFPLDFGTNF